MKIKYVVLVLAWTLGGQLSADNDTNRSFLNTQHDRDKVISQVLTRRMVSENTQQTEQRNDIGLGFMIAPSYSQTMRPQSLGEFLGVAESNKINFADGVGIGASDTVGLNSIIRASNGTNLPMGSFASRYIVLEPRQRTLAVHLDMIADMGCVCRGVTVKLGTSIINNNRNLQAQFMNDVQGVAPMTLESYFKGTSTSFQQALEFGKIATKSHSCTRLSDIDIEFLYDMVKRDGYLFTGVLAARIGIGTKPTAKNLFEEVVGRNHNRLGVGFAIDWRIFDRENDTLYFDAGAIWHVGMSAVENRMVDIKSVSWGKYLLTVKNKQGPINAANPFVPAANILPKEIVVQPGSMVKMHVNGVYEWKSFEFNVGYLFLYCQEESNRLKDDSFSDGAYNLICPGYDSTKAFVNNAGNYVPINHKDLVLNHPAQQFHTIFTGVAWYQEKDTKQFQYAVGASLNFSDNDRSAPYSGDVFARMSLLY